MARKTDLVTPQRDVKPPEHIQCAHETCDLSARVRIQTATGWAKLCEPHYERFYDDAARKAFTARGLDRRDDESAADHKKRVFRWLRENARPKTFEDAVRAEDEWAKTA